MSFLPSWTGSSVGAGTGPGSAGLSRVEDEGLNRSVLPGRRSHPT